MNSGRIKEIDSLRVIVIGLIFSQHWHLTCASSLAVTPEPDYP